MSAHRTHHHSAQESISHQVWAIPSGLQFLSHCHFSCFWGGHMVFPWPRRAPELQSAVYWEQVVLTSHNVSCPYILSAMNILPTSYGSAAFFRNLCQKRVTHVRTDVPLLKGEKRKAFLCSSVSLQRHLWLCDMLSQDSSLFSLCSTPPHFVPVFKNLVARGIRKYKSFRSKLNLKEIFFSVLF